MSIAQARAVRVCPHYILVALLLGMVAAIAFGTLATQAQVSAPGGTMVYHDANGNNTFNAEEDAAVAILSDGSVALGVESRLSAATEMTPVTETGILTTNEGSLESVDGPSVLFISWTNSATNEENISIESKYFPGGFVGTATIRADNLTGTQSTDNAPLTVASYAAPLDVDVAFVANANADSTVKLDRIGVEGCGDCRNNGADITVTVKDAEGSALSEVEVKLTLDSLTQGRFSGTGDDDTDDSVSASTADGTNDTVAGAVSFAGSDDSDVDVFQASDTPGTATFSVTVLGASFEAELLVTGAPAELVLSTSRVDRSSTDLADVKDLGAELFSVGLTDSTEAVVDDENTADIDETTDARVGTDVFIVYVAALDADGNEVDADATPLPVVKDVTDGVDKAILFSGDNAVAGFGVGDDDVEAVGDDPAAWW